MRLSALTDPAPRISEIDFNLLWDRLRNYRIPPRQVIHEARTLLREGLNNQEAVHLFYQLGGVINASKLYSVPEDRFAIRNFTLEAALTWLVRDFDPVASFPPKSIGKLYAAFSHVGARLPKKIHQYLRDKVRDNADAFLAKDGRRIIEYYATTADHISASVFEVAVKAIERDPDPILLSRQLGFLNNLAIFDSMYDEGHFSKEYAPRAVFNRNIERISASNLSSELGKADIARQWFAGERTPLNSNGLKHMGQIQETAKRLEVLGFDIYSDFQTSATNDDTNGLDFSVGMEGRDQRVGVIYDTAVKYVEGNTFPRTLFPSGRTLFNSASVQKLYPDRVVVRVSTIAMNQFKSAVIGRAFEDAFRAPANVYGLDEKAELQPMRKLSFKS